MLCPCVRYHGSLPRIASNRWLPCRRRCQGMVTEDASKSKVYVPRSSRPLPSLFRTLLFPPVFFYRSFFFRGGSLFRIVYLSCCNLGTGPIRSHLVRFLTVTPPASCSGRVFSKVTPGNHFTAVISSQLKLLLGYLQPASTLYYLPYLSTAPSRPPLFHLTMGFLTTFTFRFALLLWFTNSLALALPADRGWDMTSLHRFVRAPVQSLADEDPGTAASNVGQSGVDPGSVSDGGGSGFDIPAVLWLSFGLSVGLFLTLGGMRLWRVTTAMAIGLVFSFCVWVAIVNVMESEGPSDILLALITLSSFVVGSLGGLFKFCRLAGLTALSILGGMSVGMRLVLMREGLLLHPTALNWIVIVVCAVAGFAATLLRQRMGIALSCTFTGTFLLSLGIDLVANQQKGVSRGLRHLLDGNGAHSSGLSSIPYKPPVSTQVLLSVSIALALATAYVQFRFFSEHIEEPSRPRPFILNFASIRSTQSSEKLEMDTLRLPLQRPPTYPENRFSL